MTVFRSVAAVLLGYLVFTVSAVALFRFAGRNPHAPQGLGFMLFATAYGLVFAAGAGTLAARIAGRRRALHAGLVGGLIALGAILSLVLSPPADATWTQWTALLLMAPAAWLVGALLPRRAR